MLRSLDMSVLDRPGNGPKRAPEGAPAGLHVVRGGRSRRQRRAVAGVASEVAERLSTLERQVEEALGTGSFEGGMLGRDAARAALDGALGALAGARRRTLGELLALVGRPAAGMAREVVEGNVGASVLHALYRWWWRVEALGLERIPASGPVIIAVNRSGALVPYEAFMIRLALAAEHPAPRVAWPLVDDWLLQHPFVGPVLGMRSMASARRFLARDEAVILFPEGRDAVAKPFRERYRLARFGRGGFARLAIEMRAPIVPVAVIGAEEIQPVLARLDAAGRFLGLPTLPLTPTFPWLGIAGLVPLPTRWTLMVGEPLEVSPRYSADDATDAAAVGRVRDQVRERLQALILEGLRRRRSIFR